MNISEKPPPFQREIPAQGKRKKKFFSFFSFFFVGHCTVAFLGPDPDNQRIRIIIRTLIRVEAFDFLAYWYGTLLSSVLEP